MTASAADITFIRSTQAIRERCEALYVRAKAGHSQHFRLDESRIPACALYVLDVIKAAYPRMDIPYHSRWRHFDVGGIDRVSQWTNAASLRDPLELARSKFDLAVTSVLLDAGAGSAWKYREPSSGQTWTRSEGLAVASFDLFASGAFSADKQRPFMATGAGLKALTLDQLNRAFQVSPSNPLVGAAGRLNLLHRLGAALTAHPEYFGREGRVGLLVDHFVQGSSQKKLRATAILAAVLNGLGSIWPGRIELAGVNLGDVWRHTALPEDGLAAQLVPFHKLSQWLTYSLMEPLEELGLVVDGVDELTGLPEYRNGGLFLDLGVIIPLGASFTTQPQRPSDEPVVEWRALTVCLLDRVAAVIRRELNMSPAALPLAKVLQGGTWTAGRQIAAKLRANGGPPVQIESDGTVF